MLPFGGFEKGHQCSGLNILPIAVPVGTQSLHGMGLAWAFKLRKEKKVAITFLGDGATSEGDFHEALNVAAVWQLPVIFLIENNGYGLSTPSVEQFHNPKLSDRGLGYGMKSMTIDGNNILEVYNTIADIKKSIKKHPEPYLVECITFRMRGHEEASGTKYVPKKLFIVL